ncbi:MAG: hypothetical protein D6758_13860 [Gammaproteobacteria bacterium]|nr:MAG: hypothetical protein D6758_13860 [Gammaproteobacteria bacterium]
MRWIFLSLFLLNLLVLAAQYNGWGAAPVVRQQPVVHEGAQPLIMLRELKATDPYKSVLVADARNKTTGNKKERLCLLFGPIYDKTEAEELVSYLSNNRVRARQIEREREVAPDYWVYIPPLPSRAQANKKLAELQVRKIDSYRISQGPLRNGISLGLFRNIDSARAMLEERRKQGLNAEMKEVRRTRKEYWVTPEDPSSVGLRARVDPLFLGSKQWSRIERREILCEGLASEKKVP